MHIRPPRSAQQGAAAILLVLLVGIAIAGSALGTAYYLKTSQQSLSTSHALNNAQSGAWTGVEIFRKYLDHLDSAGIKAIHAQNLNLKILDGRVIKIKNITTLADPQNQNIFKVSAYIENISEYSEASATIHAVYEIDTSGNKTETTDPQPSEVAFTEAINFYGNFEANGGIHLSNAGEHAVVNLSGDFSTNSGLTGIKEIYALGSVKIGGGGINGLENVYSNANVELNASGKANLVSAKGTVITSGGVEVGTIYADGNVTIGSSSPIKSIDTKSALSITGNSKVNTTIVGLTTHVSNGAIVNALSNGNIHYKVWNDITTAKTGGTFYCTSQNWEKFTQLSATAFVDCPTHLSNRFTTLPTGTQPANPQGALTTVSMQSKPLVNALSYETQANYIFNVDSNNKIKIKVQHLSGVVEGEYYIGKYQKDYSTSWGYLCKTLDSQDYCSSPIVANFARDLGWSNVVISYKNGSWSLSDNQSSELSIPPGILLFKNGSVNITQGFYANTILAADDISYGGSVILKAPNFANVSTVCASSRYRQPTNLCSSSTSFTPLSLGNIALLSGSCTDSNSISSCAANYKGGNIHFGGSAKVEGNIIAGNKISTGGATEIKGSVLSAGLGTNNTNTLGGSTTIDFNGAPDDGTVIYLPAEKTPSPESPTNSNEEITRATLKWARYI